MSELQGNGGDIWAKISITRKSSGLTETYELVGPITVEQEKELAELANKLAPMKTDTEGAETAQLLDLNLAKMFDKRGVE